LEQVTCLILEKIHVYSFALTAGWFAPCRLVDGCNNQGQPYSQTHPWLQTSRLMGPSSVRNVSSKSIFVVKILDMDVNLIHGRSGPNSSSLATRASRSRRLADGDPLPRLASGQADGPRAQDEHLRLRHRGLGLRHAIRPTALGCAVTALPLD